MSDGCNLAPWDWRPSDKPWFTSFKIRAAKWNSFEGLKLDDDLLKGIIIEQASEGAQWLFNPSTTAVTLQDAKTKPQRDFQLAVWVALNTHKPIGNVELTSPMWVWAESGGFQLKPGSYELLALAVQLRTQGIASSISVDPWAHSIKVSYDQLWRDVLPYGELEKANLEADLKILFKSLDVANTQLPQCFAWVKTRTQVIIPLRKSGSQHSQSSSSQRLHGAVFFTLHDYVQAIEALVHESAHQHLFMAEMSGDLVDPHHDGLYTSPLRGDPRPLRGVLLACHALAFMGAYYVDAIAAIIAPKHILVARLCAVREKYKVAEGILNANLHHFTPDGRAFIRRTVQIGCYSE